MSALLATLALMALTATHVPVTTTDTRAQSLFDEGLLLYYAYDGGDAARAFAWAAARDPHLAMAYWGEALADGPDLNTLMTQDRFQRGKIAIARGVALEANATPSERAYIDAMALRYHGSWKDWNADDAAYRNAMTTLAQASGDATATVLAAEALMESGATARATPLVEGVLARDPQNVMANHLCVHLHDSVLTPSPAQACAQRLDAMTFPPEAEHLAHMPAHYWIETGNYAAAEASSERAASLFATLETVPDRDTDHDRYLRHDTYVGFSAAMMLGNYAGAQRWAQRMNAAYGVAWYGALAALRFDRFDDAYALAPGTSAAELAIRGYAAVRLGRIAEATAIAAALRKISTAGYISELFFARLAEANGNLDEANRWIDRALAEQQRTFGAELIPLLPALEARAGVLLRSRAYDKAVTAYDAVLAAYPNDPRALFGLSTALGAAGRTADASAAHARFIDAWQNADTTLDAGGLL